MSGGGLDVAIDTLVAEIGRRIRSGGSPLVVAIDGASGAGKSTIAAKAAAVVDAALISTDDFFAADIPAADWDRRTPAERAADAIDWRRPRREVLEPLRAGRAARWRAFDFEAGVRSDGTYGIRPDLIVRRASAVVMLEGAYSARPELADLVGMAVLVDAPAAVRRTRLAGREDPRFLEEWYARWGEAEAYYFERIRPAASFDLVLPTGGR